MLPTNFLSSLRCYCFLNLRVLSCYFFNDGIVAWLKKILYLKTKFKIKKREREKKKSQKVACLRW